MGDLVPFESTRVGKKLQQMLPPEQPVTELYHLPWQAARDALGRHVWALPHVIGGAALGIGGLIASVLTIRNLPGNPFHIGTDNASLLATAISMGAGLGPAGLGAGIGYGLKNRVRRPNEMLADKLKTRIASWAHGRYGVTLDESCLNDSLLKFLAERREPGSFKWLSAGGERFKLVASFKGYYLEEYHDPEGEHTPLGSIAAIDHVQGTDISAFTGEASTLAQQIRQQLDFLATRNLSPEGEYTLGRVTQDFKQAISLNAELLAFGEMSSEEAALMAETLGTLSAELGGLVSQERAEAVQQLRVQRDYVRDRQQQPSGRLALPAASQLPTERISAAAEDSTTTEAAVISAGLER